MDGASRNPLPIAAIATACGPSGGVCVVRVSGCGALEIGDRLAAAADVKPSQRPGGTFFHARVFDPVACAAVDDALILVFRAPHSYTGEDALEIQGHGGAVNARRLLGAALAAGARLAEPGEFTKRAFLNGRLDLTQAEAVCDLIQARTERAAHAARAQLDGALGRRVGALYERAVALCADVEHLLDFDEGEVPGGFQEEALGRLAELQREMESLLETWREGHLLRDGALVVLSGPPNAGKSSLLNALLGCDRAIVHDQPGTTRDIIEEGCAIGGVPLRLVDTAGLRAAADEVEAEGVARARSLMRQADVNVRLSDLSSEALPGECEALLELDPRTSVMAFSKCDLPPVRAAEAPAGATCVRLSARTGAGLEELRAAILEKLGARPLGGGAPAVSERHASELRAALASARGARAALGRRADELVVAANELRAASEALGRIVGRVYSADLLDAVFSRFCVGK